MRTILFFFVIFTITSCHYIEPDEIKIPEGAIWVKETVRRDTPLSKFLALAISGTTATMVGNQLPSTQALVTVNFWQVIEIIKGDSTVIYSEQYNFNYLRTFTKDEAGLYCRYPKWFDTICQDEHAVATNMVAINGALSIDVSNTPDRIVHWWTPKLSYRQGAIYCVRAKFKVEGATAIQFGMDYWVNLNSGFNVHDDSCNNSNNCEAWLSDWTGDTNGKFVTVTFPRRK